MQQTSPPPAHRRLDVDVIEQVVQLPLGQRDALLALLRRLGQAKGALVQPLVEQAQPAAIEEEHLDSLAAPTEEHEQGPRARAAPQSLRDDARQTIKAPAQIDRVQAQEDLHAVGDHDALRVLGARRSSTSRTEDSVAAQKPGRTAMRTPWASSISGGPCPAGLAAGARETRGAAARTTRASLTTSGAGLALCPSIVRSRCAQCRSPPGVKSCPVQNSFELNPLARHSSTRLFHNFVSAMPPSLRSPSLHYKDGARAAHTCSGRSGCSTRPADRR